MWDVIQHQTSDGHGPKVIKAVGFLILSNRVFSGWKASGIKVGIPPFHLEVSAIEADDRCDGRVARMPIEHGAIGTDAKLMSVRWDFEPLVRIGFMFAIWSRTSG